MRPKFLIFLLIAVLLMTVQVRAATQNADSDEFDDEAVPETKPASQSVDDEEFETVPEKAAPKDFKTGSLGLHSLRDIYVFFFPPQNQVKWSSPPSPTITWRWQWPHSLLFTLLCSCGDEPSTPRSLTHGLLFFPLFDWIHRFWRSSTSYRNIGSICSSLSSRHSLQNSALTLSASLRPC